jgi:hypothetical protein
MNWAISPASCRVTKDHSEDGIARHTHQELANDSFFASRGPKFARFRHTLWANSNNQHEDAVMAKGHRRSNREAKKPKQPKFEKKSAVPLALLTPEPNPLRGNRHGASGPHSRRSRAVAIGEMRSDLVEKASDSGREFQRIRNHQANRMGGLPLVGDLSPAQGRASMRVNLHRCGGMIPKTPSVGAGCPATSFERSAATT